MGPMSYEDGQMVHTLRPPPATSPSEAHVERLRVIDMFKQGRNKDRERKRSLRTLHEEQGKRPRRETGEMRRASIVSANVTAASSLVEELKYGTALLKDDFIAVQELACSPEECDMFSRDVVRLGYSPIIQYSYFKLGGYGGGTAILAQGIGGIRPQVASGQEGRCIFGVIELGVEVTVACVYGISGASVKEQMALWAESACRVKRMGRPFVLCGDWQIDPLVMNMTRFDRYLGATVVATPTPTNRITGTTIDYFVVDNSLMTEHVRAEAVEGCRFSPHVPVRLVLEHNGRIPRVRKISLPRTLPVDRPVGPQLPAQHVEWDGWCSDAKHTFGAGELDLDTAAQQWGAGAEVELFGIFGIHGYDDAHAYCGIGLPRHEVEMAPARTFRHTPDPQGLLGHRLNWTIRQLHFASSHAPALITFGQAMVTRLGYPGAALRQAARARLLARG